MVKKIHYCWFGGNKLPSKVKKCIETWKKFLPDYEIKEWNENNFDINTCSFVKEAYENKKWAFVSDYVRIHALYEEGGIYFDTDMKITKDVSNIVDKDMFLGYEDSGYVGTAVIGVGEKHNKYIKEILDFYNKIEHFNVDIMYNYANPVIITKMLKEYESTVDDKGITIFDDNIYVYPRDYFYPLSYNYAERVFTDNTCMVHMFNATWTDKKERRVITIYRKFGPRFGRYLNGFIDRVKNLKYIVIIPLSKMYKYFRLKMSIHLNIGKRVNEITRRLEEIEENYIVISNPDDEIEKSHIDGLFGNSIVDIRKQYTIKEAKRISDSIINAKKDIVIFNSYADGWEWIIDNLKFSKPRIKIKALFHDGIESLDNDRAWNNFEKIIDLYGKHKIDAIGLFNEEQYTYLKNKDYNVKLLRKSLEINTDIENNKEKGEATNIGLYRTIDKQSSNIYNQLSAVSLLENVKLDCEPISYKISIFARRFNIDLLGDTVYAHLDKLYNKMAKNDINLFVRFDNDYSILPAKSLELGTLCLTGEYKLFENTELEQYIKVENPNDINEIYEKINTVIKEKEKIFVIYKKWREEYLKEAKDFANNFIKEN